MEFNKIRIWIVVLFSITYIIHWASLFLWTFIFYGIMEGFLPGGGVSADASFKVIVILNFVFAAILLGISLLIYSRIKNKKIFWIGYLAFTLFLFIATNWIFKGFVI